MGPVVESTIARPGIYDEICANALAATGAALVVMTKYDPATITIRNVAWSARHQGVIRGTIDAVRNVMPSFDPMGGTFRADANPILRAAYAEGTAFTCTIAEAGAGTAPPYVLDLIGRLAGINYCRQEPLVVDRVVEGALIFYSGRLLHASVERVCGAFARQVTLSLENARLLEEARSANARLQAIFDATSDAIVVVDRRGKLANVNPAGRAMMEQFEVPSFETIEEATERFGASRELHDVGGLSLTRTLAEGVTTSGIVAWTDRGGVSHYLAASAAPFGVKEANEIQGAVVIARDVTALRATIEQNSQLDGAIKTARAIVHEVNNQLTLTVGYGHLLVEALAGQPGEKAARSSLQAAERASEIVQNLLRIARFAQSHQVKGLGMLDLDASTAGEAPHRD